MRTVQLHRILRAARASEVPRYGLYGAIFTGVTARVVIAVVVGAWARGAIVWTAQYKLYAALAFWVLWGIPAIVQTAIEIANRMVLKCPDCGSTNLHEHATPMSSSPPSDPVARAVAVEAMSQVYRKSRELPRPVRFDHFRVTPMDGKFFMERVDNGGEWWPCGIKDTAEEAQGLIDLLIRVDEREPS